jgi:hypothetical protein
VAALRPGSLGDGVADYCTTLVERIAARAERCLRSLRS